MPYEVCVVFNFSSTLQHFIDPSNTSCLGAQKKFSYITTPPPAANWSQKGEEEDDAGDIPSILRQGIKEFHSFAEDSSRSFRRLEIRRDAK